MTLQRFIEKWTHPEYPPAKLDEEALRSVETSFGFVFPDDYREEVLAFGLPRPTIALLDTIDDHDLELADVADFLGPKEMIQVTNDWQELGLPSRLVAFASDCMGNLFCFPTDGLSREQGTAPVVYFDHDSGNVETIASSFGAWLDEFCELPAPLNPTITES